MSTAAPQRSGDGSGTRPSARRLAQFAAAVRDYEDRRERLTHLQDEVDKLGRIDLIVVDGERQVLTRLALHLDNARALLTDLTGEGADTTAALNQLTALVACTTWNALDEVTKALDEKQKLVNQARTDVQRRLATWAAAATEVTQLQREIMDRRLPVVEPRALANGRRRMDALIRQATTAQAEDRLLDAMTALNELEASPPSDDSTKSWVGLREVPGQLKDIIKRAKIMSGGLQLTVLRGPQDEGRFEYTLMMLLAPTAERHIGINVQDSTTIVSADRKYFLQEVDTAAGGSYSLLRQLRDGRPPKEIEVGNPSAVARLRTMGSVLYKLLVPDRMKEEMVRHPDTPVTVISNDLELPWELMYDEGFLALNRPVARMPVGRFPARQWTVQRASDRRRVALVASAGPHRELTGAIREVNQIKERLQGVPDLTVDTFVTGEKQNASGDRFREILLSGDYDILHYAGHAVFDVRRPDQSGLLLEDDEVCFAQKIQRLLLGNPLVFLNACESARLREDMERDQFNAVKGDAREGLASAFVYGGALGCIGTLWPVLDTVAAEFAAAFYRCALDGYPLGEAMRAARTKTATSHQDDPSWAAFVLYGDPWFNLPTAARLEGYPEIPLPRSLVVS